MAAEVASPPSILAKKKFEILSPLRYITIHVKDSLLGPLD